MEGLYKVVKINGIYYPIIHNDFFDISLPLQQCEVCSNTLCAKCLDPFDIVHECKYKYFIVSHENYLCIQCQKQREEEKRKELKDKMRRAIQRVRNKTL